MSQANQDASAIKEMVREHYGSRIQSVASSCCGLGASGSCCAAPTEVTLYGTEALASLPADVTITSYG
jgi:hypothetical protein